MKKVILFLIFIASFVLILASAAAAYPFYIYSRMLKADYDSDWFRVRNYRESLLVPAKSISLVEPEASNEDLWSQFHFMDVVVPLPVKNPFYNVTVDIRYNKKAKINNLGLVVYGTSGKELLKIYFNKNSSMPSVINNQKIFKLPLAKEVLNQKKDSELWKDLFSKNISAWNIPFDEMLYNLYLLELRSRVVPKNIKSYSLIKGSNSAVIELISKNKDYKSELVLTKSRGFIYSYLLVSKIKDDESQKLRSRLLHGVKFRGGSEYLSRIIYQEFKNLSYQEKTDHLGMLYLISSWSHDQGNESLMKELISYLERGTSNQKQLQPLVEYSFSRYGKTNLTRQVKGLNLKSKTQLKAMMEIESLKNTKEFKKRLERISLEPEIEEETIFERKKREVREAVESKKTRMIID